MGNLVLDALKSADLPAAMARADVGWGDYLRGRRTDAAFDLACLEIDLVIRQALLIQLESRAAQGDHRAAKLLAGGLAEIRAALAAQGVGPEGLAPRSYWKSAELGGQSFPEGPCSHCIAGLVVLIPWIAGNEHEVIVRHDDARSFGIEAPIPPGWEGSPILYGVYPETVSEPGSFPGLGEKADGDDRADDDRAGAEPGGD